ncbi:hypothetical protein EV644_12981 [Kribbella orskensis]|uniref:Nitroreductase family protein n=1 Tax=Kribbella orskensis TaxID=2512216 RepID=A0ABY2B8U3_9ACTN|nr:MULTISPECIES: hypothetical protein [Kribbella]TCN31206.1 hypothetical protein EV642_13181 [Kribbella sp. VKM Ac-2500]TCO11712.1 hypothetical protein EV644_12981 [Kribbella orskensis]
MNDDQLSMEEIDVLLRAAVAAPSMHNTQPWRFEVNGHVIDVFLDGSRSLPAEDPTGRAMRIAAGAATFNLRCAAASMGYSSWFGLAPDRYDPDLVARVVIAPTDEPDKELTALSTQIPRRHTSREPLRPVQLTNDDQVALSRAAMAEGAELSWLPAPGDQGRPGSAARHRPPRDRRLAPPRRTRPLGRRRSNDGRRTELCARAQVQQLSIAGTRSGHPASGSDPAQYQLRDRTGAGRAVHRWRHPG